jgi:uncharacterized C2H2 Zn-finger protein
MNENEHVKIFRYRFFALVCLYIGALSIFLCALDGFFAIIPISLFITFVTVNLIFWRCPACGKGFEMRHSKMDRISHCPYCGVKLREEQDSSYNWR